MDSPASFYRWRPHPWHGIAVGPEPPRRVHAYIESSPFDLVKYEIDKRTGYLRVDRPHRSSSQQPTLYGFIPRTYAGERVRQLMVGALRGDGDPLDVCVVSERPISRSEVILTVRVVGGLPMLDHGEADDKILAVLENDPFWGEVESIRDIPHALIERLRHYFMTYKSLPKQPADVTIGEPYDRDHAEHVVSAAIQDYKTKFGTA